MVSTSRVMEQSYPIYTTHAFGCAAPNIQRIYMCARYPRGTRCAYQRVCPRGTHAIYVLCVGVRGPLPLLCCCHGASDML